MIKRCAWCKKLNGICKPYLSFETTHGKCDKCVKGGIIPNTVFILNPKFAGGLDPNLESENIGVAIDISEDFKAGYLFGRSGINRAINNKN